MARPRLCVPLVTPLRDGAVDEAGLRRLVRFLADHGADVLFVSGTTGEHALLPEAQRERLREVAVDAARATGLPCWVGVTGVSQTDTREMCHHAVDAGADAVVVAPTVLPDLGALADLVDRLASPVPLYLYENPDLVGGRRLDPGEVVALRRDIAGIKVSAPAEVVEPYLGHLPVWVGHADAWFALAGHGPPPDGVVMGMANALPGTWRAILDDPDPSAEALCAAYTAATVFDGRRHTIACFKAALVERGVLETAEVLPGTPALSADQEARFRAAYRALGGA